MACDRGRDRTLLLSLGLFGAPASQAERDRAAQAMERKRTQSAVPVRGRLTAQAAAGQPVCPSAIGRICESAAP